MRSGWRSAGLCGGLLCACGDAAPPVESGRIQGVARLADAVGVAALTLRSLNAAGVAGAIVATGETDATGRFDLHAALVPGDYRLDVDTAALHLSALLTGVDYGDRRVVSVNAYSTWAAALCEGERSLGNATPRATAQAAVVAHLGFEPTGTDDGLEARLLAAAFPALAARAGRGAGASSVALSPERLLAALVLDAGAGGHHPGAGGVLMDGAGPAGPVELAVGPGVYRLGPETLRTELQTAVLDVLATAEFAATEPRDVRALLSRLQCSDSPVFPSCEGGLTPADPSPPEVRLSAPRADATVVSGVVEVSAVATDPESGVATLSATVEGTDGSSRTLEDEDPAPDSFRGRWETAGGGARRPRWS